MNQTNQLQQESINFDWKQKSIWKLDKNTKVKSHDQFKNSWDI